MILGIGIDIVAVERIKIANNRWGEKFLKRVFTEDEIKYSLMKRIPYRHLAARFASKEALIKALGMGLTEIISLKNIEIVNSDTGAPSIILHGRLKEIISARGVSKIHLSISHDGDYAIAQVILEGSLEESEPCI